MIFDYLTIKDFLGIIAIFPFINFLILVLFDGIGIFKDNFYMSNRQWR